MNDHFDTEEQQKNFVRRIGSLTRIADFLAVAEALRQCQDKLNYEIRHMEDENRLRILQGKSQMLEELLFIIDQSKLAKI